MVLASSMRHVLTQYDVAHGTMFACDLASLTRLLKRAADQVQTSRDLLNQYKSIASGKGGRVPKKACFASQGDNEPGEVSRSDGQKKKECDYCAKWKPEVKNTHRTKDCKIWNEDGSRQNRGSGGKCGGVRGHKKYNYAIKKAKALEKKLKNQKKNTQNSSLQAQSAQRRIRFFVHHQQQRFQIG